MIANEAARLRALHAYHILDTDPEQAFDDLTLLASQVCGTPIALITLVDEKRQWFKSKVGIDVQETARSISFCSHAIEQPGLFEVPDTFPPSLLWNFRLASLGTQVTLWTALGLAFAALLPGLRPAVREEPAEAVSV